MDWFIIQCRIGLVIHQSIQSFSYQSPDIEMDITDMVNAWITGSDGASDDDYIANNGLLLYTQI